MDEKWIKSLLPEERVQEFFEAFYFGEEPAYYLDLGLREWRPEKGRVVLELRLTARPDKCLACNLTSGLPPVLKKHPILNLAGIVSEIAQKLEPGYKVDSWDLGWTEEVNHDLHVIPLVIKVSKS
ncbi:hypothetical protein [Thermodesulfatator autotrophicus]|uniref:Pancreas/duodenum homeobox protein 1 n=1 Tax=Thermodesulfatator autotrophicus TaxID=1795632 RepID=A0A177E7C0_9BACT|nr:hypothetical protein [Thermodesulfatator autotrophicus]OAG27843.1 hypothetical protein TH606_04745 [Thermodesulfatator autotrophicus]